MCTRHKNTLLGGYEQLTLASSPYRAPELLFGARSYDPFTIDLWSLGATFAGFFTPLRFHSDEEDEFPDESDDDNQPPNPFIVPKGLDIMDPDARWTRDTLFNGDRGEIGLAWSIFKIRGTPTANTWPVSCILHRIRPMADPYRRDLKTYQTRRALRSMSYPQYLYLHFFPICPHRQTTWILIMFAGKL